ncbi:hypothetical protein PI172_0639 [Prevotella intermedia]|uniref:Uncharacterized protein n=1 Tax=Prevotella intermedia TaxID=28131 RepID=A0AAD1BFL0_PREIN|nr:hypothetical protein [Prevotella intermedia]AFJ08386.1 hypothetical protein PIN17_A0037 [Prevotella intermedia 17]APW34883.1 hypothetical protein BWX40_08630 [Prevotella intermedia]BAR95367.1 hypothetical protein PI172_0639 [Prevotella intermedia]
MTKILEGQVLINGTDIYKEYGVFLTEERKGGRDNLNAILAPSKAKDHAGVDIREHSGKKYSKQLFPANAERDVTLHFAQYAPTRQQWLERYMSFIRFLKSGNNGWLTITFTTLNLTIRVFYLDSSAYRSLTYLWTEGIQASSYKVKFREPEPII